MPGQSIDDIYVEIRLAQQQLKKDIDKVQKDSEKSAKEIERLYKKTTPSFNNTLLKKNLSEIITIRDKLKAKLQEKIFLNADLKSIDRTRTQLNKVEGALKGVENQSQKTNAPIKKIGENFLGLIGIMVLFRQAWNFTKEVKNAARDAFETQNKFNEVFITIASEANKTADEITNAFDLAGSTTRKLLSNVGDVLTGFGFGEDIALGLSRRVVELSQDLASFTNFEGGAERATEALTKAIVGETESAKALGIVIRQQTKEFNDEVETLKRTQGLTETQARAVVILNEATRQSKKAVGDYARTKDSLANIERRVNEELKESKERLGNEVIPLFKIFLSYIIQTANNMGGLNGELTAFGAAAKSISTPLIIIFTLLKQLGNLLGVTGAMMLKFFQRDWAGLAIATSMGTDIIVKDFEIMAKSLTAIWTDTAKKINETPIVIGGGGGGGGENIVKGVAKTIGDIKKEIESLQRVQDTLIPGSKEYLENLKQIKNLTKLIEADTRDASEKLIEKIKTEVELKELTYKLSQGVLQSAMDTLKAQLALTEKEKDSTENQKKKLELIKAINELTEKQKELEFEFEPQIDTAAIDQGLAEDALKRAKERQDLEKESVETIKQLRIDAIDEEFEKKKEIIELEREEALRNLYGLALIETELKEAQNNIDKKYANDLADLTTQKFSAGLSAARSIASSLSTIVGTGNSFVESLQQALAIAEAISAAITAGKTIATLLGIPIGATGGEFAHGKKVASYNQIPKFATGGEFNVPSKYTNDSFLMRVSGDERVRVTPANQVGNTDKLLSVIAGKISALNQNVSNLETRVNVVNNAPDVDTVVKRNKRVENNLARQGVKFNEY